MARLFIIFNMRNIRFSVKKKKFVDGSIFRVNYIRLFENNFEFLSNYLYLMMQRDLRRVL